MLQVNQDWTELLQSLNAQKVDYLIVGAFAVAFHGFPRYTGDLDVFVASGRENAQRLHDALTAFGAPVGSLTADSIGEEGTTLTFGVPPRRIDILNWLSGVEWSDAVSDAVTGEFGTVPVRYISIRTLRKNKLATNRPQDMADLERLPKD